MMALGQRYAAVYLFCAISPARCLARSSLRHPSPFWRRTRLTTVRPLGASRAQAQPGRIAKFSSAAPVRLACLPRLGLAPPQLPETACSRTLRPYSHLPRFLLIHERVTEDRSRDSSGRLRRYSEVGTHVVLAVVATTVSSCMGGT
ncbi:uncharacterized protein K452DRAFT_37508 [Aplosporella prunicola CBS 121167]|uniref:Uncharacterized protein n=1 Tax=Aplosporella prunicola CBS 121167 TaxID=1176127 RepID=A0A6A6BB54_9PEZI|nr:uncharacterized protein K452DRAFT_37508 [Aplosporella prunicola CBS 121167]KAF2141276.1 hypothetical protein K452DRAFT_37508 [Aplosporella prunicola CBS 121167]